MKNRAIKKIMFEFICPHCKNAIDNNIIKEQLMHQFSSEKYSLPYNNRVKCPNCKKHGTIEL